jgi:hypothetical protein
MRPAPPGSSTRDKSRGLGSPGRGPTNASDIERSGRDGLLSREGIRSRMRTSASKGGVIVAAPAKVLAVSSNFARDVLDVGARLRAHLFSWSSSSHLQSPPCDRAANCGRATESRGLQRISSLKGREVRCARSAVYHLSWAVQILHTDDVRSSFFFGEGDETIDLIGPHNAAPEVIPSRF